MLGDITLDGPTACALHLASHQAGEDLRWQVHDRPADYPASIVARPAVIRTGRPLDYVLVADSIFDIRMMLPSGLRRYSRQAGDQLNVVEVWA
jgi:hypothetical protein